MATAYLAREIYDNHKRVAVVYQTPGDGGNNQVGPEQAAALGDLRQIEARRAVGSLGITNVWFLGGHDTASQNALASLEHCENHGRCLDQLVRIVRITQPSVILTWLPDCTTERTMRTISRPACLRPKRSTWLEIQLYFPSRCRRPRIRTRI